MFRLSPQMFCLSSLLFFASLANGLDTNLDETEKQFEAQFHIKYSNKTDEKKAAAQLSKAEKEINENNLKYLNGNSTFTLQLNQFSDLPKDLFEKEKLGLIPVTSQGRSLGLIVDPLQEKTTDPQLEEFYRSMSREVTPEQWDSVSKGLVTSVKNQRSCGSCAAFSATSLHETCMLMSGARFNALDLSEQYIIDCGYNGMSMKGCHGASPNAYQDWFSNNGGQSPHEVDYPYLDINPNLRCPDNPKIFNSGAFVANSMADYNCNEDKMVQLVSKFGSVSTAIYAGDQSFGNLGMDVFSGCSNQQINHAVTVVGYGIENGLKYWLVKNSWGTYWGINGYFKIRRGTGECSIGSICVVSSCSKTNGKPSEPPVAPPPAPIPASQTCDVTSLFGPFVTGNYIFRVFSNGQQIQSYVSCTDSICRPSTAGPSNACIYICGRLQC